MLIIYVANDEILVCTPETEPYMLKAWFKEGGRDEEDYDREIASDGVFEVHARLVAF